MEENEQFQNTLHSLTDALKKQQYSYNTIRRVTDVFFENIVHLQELQDDESRSQAAVLKQIFDMYLRMQTTESLPLERFEEIVRSDFDKLAKQAEGMELGEVHSCLTGDVQRTMAVNIRFAVWLILYTCLGSKITASVTSGYITVKEVKFIVTLQGEKKKIPFRERYLSECLHILTKSCEIKENGSETVYDLTFIPVEQH